MEEPHIPLIRWPSPDPTSVHSAIQNPKATNTCLPLPINQSTPASIIFISPQSSSDLDTDHRDVMDETIKHIMQTMIQTLLTSNASYTSRKSLQ